MSDRTIRSHSGSKCIQDALASLLVLEIIKPSSKIYIISPWISNSPIIEQRNKSFLHLFPFVESRTVYFADIISTLAWKGTKIRLICDLEQYATKKFIEMAIKSVEYKQYTGLHEKGLITDNFYVHGSMNFTYSGIHINSECVRITNSKAEISNAKLSAEHKWEDSP